MDTSSPLPLPRLRLSRHSPPYRTANSLTPIASSSRIHLDTNNHDTSDEELDAEATPRIGSASIAPDPSWSRPSTSSMRPSDATARLRAVMQSANNASSSRASVTPAQPPAPTPLSDYDSDFDAPYSYVNNTTHSVARESLKDLFAHALRDSGDTPRKGKQRRNSIDLSEVEDSPRIELVEKERAKNKGKRKSLSDEEADNSRSLHQSNTPNRFSGLASLDALRARLGQSTTLPPIPPSQRMVMDLTMPPEDSSGETETLEPHVDASVPAAPETNNTQMNTLRMSTAQFHMQSNLLDQDSEMQKALRGVESETESAPSEQPVSFPSTRPERQPASPARPVSWNSHSSSHNTHNLPFRRRSEDFDKMSSRASSSLSEADYKERQDDSHREQVYDRERKWNYPRESPARVTHAERSSTGSSSPAARSSRRNSTTSLQQFDDGLSSKASSIVSRQEDVERGKELEQERNKEREREWNRRFSKYPRRPSTTSQPDIPRVRKSSLPSPSDPFFPPLTPNRLKLFRHGSRNSVSSTGSLESPTASVSGARERRTEPEQDVDTEPEDEQGPGEPARRRSVSPPPSAALPSKRTSTLSSFLARTRLSRDDGGTPEPSDGRADYQEPPSTREGSSPRPRTPQPSGSENVAPDAPSSSPSRRQDGGGPSPGQRSRFGWQFFQNRASLSPLEMDDSRSITSSPPASKGPVRSSIPIRSPRKVGQTSSNESIGERTITRRGSRRSILTPEPLFEEPFRLREPEGTDREVMPTPQPDVPMFASEDESPAATSTPTMSSQGLAEAQAARSPSPISQVAFSRSPLLESDLRHEVLAKSFTPPPSPPEERPRPDYTLQTPPRRNHNGTTLEFQTPSPPRGMPDLPDPPSSDEDDAYENIQTPRARTPEFAGNLTSLKTPRPPGAWAPTPVPSRAHEPISRSQSTPPGADNASKELPETPVPDIPRSNSLPLRTPVPPGGWITTPGNSTRRKSILKVRFDVESDATSDNTPGSAPAASSGSQAQLNVKSEAADLGTSVATITDTTSLDDVGFDTWLDGTPRTSHVERRKLRKTPTLRIVDAYGRETTEPAVKEESAAVQADVIVPKEEAPASTSVPAVSTPRKRKGGIRMLDAMGREIEEPEEEPSLDVGSMPRDEVLRKAQETIAHLADDLQDADRSLDGVVVHQERLDELHKASKAARNARSEISKNLQSVKSKQDLDLKSKYDRLREGMRNSRLMSVTIEPGMRSWKLSQLWFIIGFLLLQGFLLLLMYRHSIVRAKRIFLTTYYDPFYPELYLHILKSETFSFIPTSSWSLSSFSDTVSRAGWSGVVAEGWGNATHALSHWIRPIWELPLTQAQERTAWPPT